MLATQSGKTFDELRKLTPDQQLTLANEIAQKKRGSQPELNIFGVRAQTATDYLPTVLVNARKAQAAAQKELNTYTAENASMQADLTKATIDGYNQEIAQLREKIKLKQIDRKEGEADIKRLKDLINTAKGIAPKVDMTPIGASGTVKKPRVLNDANYGSMALNKRIAERLEREIQNAGGVDVSDKINQLRIVREEIERLESLTSKNQPANVTGISAIATPDFNEKLRASLQSFVQIAAITPELFQNTNIDDFLNQLEKGAPTLDFYNNQITALKALVATLALNGIEIPDKVIKSLEKLKAAVKDAEDTANKIDKKTESGGTGDADMSGWEDKAEQKIARLKAMGIEINATKEEVAQAMKALAEAWVKGGSAMFQAMGAAIAKGEDPLKAALQSITETIGNFLIQQGEALAMAALFSTAASAVAGPFAALLALPTAGAVAAAGIMIAGGAAIKTIGATALEGGGLAKGPTLAYIGESAKARAGGGELVTSVDQGTRLIAKGLVNMGAVQAATPSSGSMTPNIGPGGMNITLDGKFELSGHTALALVKRAIASNVVFGSKKGPTDPFWRKA
jgi:low affinity Fe/Cu permease